MHGRNRPGTAALGDQVLSRHAHTEHERKHRPKLFYTGNIKDLLLLCHVQGWIKTRVGREFGILELVCMIKALQCYTVQLGNLVGVRGWSLELIFCFADLQMTRKKLVYPAC